MNRKALKLQDAQKRLQEDKLMKAEIQIKKIKDEMDKLIEKDLIKRIKKEQELYIKQIEELNQDVKKRA